jgi:uridine kinase
VTPLDDLVRAVVSTRAGVPLGRSALVALSGIDASGKGFVARRLAERLEDIGLNTATLGVDPWLNLPQRRFASADPGPHFYAHAIRFDEMFARLVLPLRDTRAVAVEAELAEETATEFVRGRYALHDVDVILLEGIFLLKRELRPHYDLALWIDCSFETALERAVARAQEGLAPADTIRAYRTIYFPAQRVHIERDDPVAAADLVVPNDPVWSTRR